MVSTRRKKSLNKRMLFKVDRNRLAGMEKKLDQKTAW